MLRKRFLLCSAAAMLLNMPGIIPAKAATINWNVTTGDWSVPGNWSLNRVPNSSDDAYVTSGRTANITLTGEVCSSLYVSNNTGNGTIQMTDGALSSISTQYIGYYGKSGTFSQSGGTNTTSDLNIGSYGTYILSGTGHLSASRAVMGNTYGGTALFHQTGGINTVNYMAVQTGSRYLMAGGTHTAAYLNISGSGQYLLQGGALQINDAFLNGGTFDGANSPATINANCLMDLTTGTWKNLGSTSVALESNSLLIVPIGFNSLTFFGSLNSSGLIHTLGDTLTVPAGQGFGGSGTIADFVDCLGTIRGISNGGTTLPINLKNGLAVSGSGNVDLTHFGELTVNDSLSGIHGGSLAGGNQYVGNSGTGVFSHSSGINTLSGSLYLGYSSGTGTYNLNGDAVCSTSTLEVGYSGYGTFNMSGNSRLTASNQHIKHGIFNQTGGSYTVSSAFEVGDSYSGGDGTYNLESGQLEAGYEFIGHHRNAAALFQQTGGTNTVRTFLTLDCGATYQLSGESQLFVSDQENINHGTFIQASGTNSLIGIDSTDGLYIGSSSGDEGIYTLTGGINSISKQLNFASNQGSTGTYNLEGGTLILKAISQGSGTAHFNFGGGILQASGTFTTTLPMKLTGANGDAKVNTNSNNVTLSGALWGPGGLNKLGPGTLTLNASNSYNGSTNITAGTLKLGSTGSIANSNAISLASGTTFNVASVSGGFQLGAGQTLKGLGTVVGNLNINGNHAPGASPGIQTVQGNYNLQGQLLIELKGTTAGSGYDQVLISGSSAYNAALGGTLSLDWTGLTGSSDATQLWILRNNTTGTLSGAFANYANGASLGNYDGRNWYLWCGADAATGKLSGGNDILLTPVPEPPAILLLIMAFLGLLAARLRA
jgi:autotransporter-associated beta strand protein